MKIAFFDVKKWEKPIIKKGLKGHELVLSEEPLTINNVDKFKNYEVISIFIYSKIDKKLLAKLPKLKLIATKSTGFDHINLNECKKRKIKVCNVPFYGENTVAEHTFALMLALSRNVHKSYLRSVRGDYSIKGLMGFDLEDKTLGVIGAGHIGLHVIRIAKAFGMHVRAFDVNKEPFLAEVLNFKYVSLDEMYKQADIITLHAPHNKHTHHMLNEEAFKKMKKGVMIINTSRGELIDTEALIKAMDKKIVAGAGLDVIEGEKLIRDEKRLEYDTLDDNTLETLAKDHLLLSRDNVVFTPHIAFYSQEALKRIIQTTVQNISKFSEGKITNSVTR